MHCHPWVVAVLLVITGIVGGVRALDSPWFTQQKGAKQINGSIEGKKEKKEKEKERKENN